MFKKKNKQKRFSAEFSLNSGNNSNGFILRVTESSVDIETRTKDWKVTFSVGSYEYAAVVHLVGAKEFDGLYQSAVAMLAAKTVIREVSMITDIFKASDKAHKKIAARLAKMKSEQSDEEILSEEKVLHEQTVESVEELEEIKKKR